MYPRENLPVPQHYAHVLISLTCYIYPADIIKARPAVIPWVNELSSSRVAYDIFELYEWTNMKIRKHFYWSEPSLDEKQFLKKKRKKKERNTWTREERRKDIIETNKKLKKTVICIQWSIPCEPLFPRIGVISEEIESTISNRTCPPFCSWNQIICSIKGKFETLPRNGKEIHLVNVNLRWKIDH